jgi:signal transduction histidine kinase
LAADLAIEIISKVQKLDPTLLELVENISRSADAAGHVLNDALNLQRLENGTFEFVHKPFLLVQSFLQVVSMMRPQLAHKDIKVIPFFFLLFSQTFAQQMDLQFTHFCLICFDLVVRLF